MKKQFNFKQFIFNGDIADPLYSNFLIFVGTYFFVIISCVLMCRDLPQDSGFWPKAMQIIADAIIPTTITFCISIIIQNIGTAIIYRIRQCSLTIFTLLLTIMYTLIYSIFRSMVASFLPCLILIGSTLFVLIMSFYALYQLNINHNDFDMDRHLSG